MVNIKDIKSWSIFKLINNYFIKNKIGLIFSVVFPFLFMLIFFIMGLYVDNEPLNVIDVDTLKITSVERSGFMYFVNSFPAYMTLAICPLSMLSLPIMNIEFRNSILLKKVKSSGVSKYTYNAIVFGYFMMMSTIAALITLIFFFLFLINKYELLAGFNWLTVIFGIISLMVTTITFSMFTSTFIKSGFSCQILNVGIILVSLALSGQFIPLEVLAKVKPIKYMNLFSPIGYSQTTINMGCATSFNGNTLVAIRDANGAITGANKIFISSSNNIFDWTKDLYFLKYEFYPIPLKPFANNLPDIPAMKSGLKVYSIWQKVTSVIFPFFISGAFAFVSSYFFKWSNR